METTIIETTAPVAEEIVLIAEDAVAEVEATETVETTRDYWTPEGLKESAPIMGKGMLGIFIVMGIVIACVSILNNASGPKKKKEKKQ
ncbi:MAG: hypothetical protein IKK63_08610 [Clostridia bacterium]|nr:hypothetical protein [Clostridia bacterium]MBR3818373.1 hypothetical protein [Clostridia bacterium]